MRDQVLWRKISRIIMLLARQLEVSPQRALEIFYETRVSDRLHDPRYGLHLMSDAYILEDIIRELQKRVYQNSGTPFFHIQAVKDV